MLGLQMESSRKVTQLLLLLLFLNAANVGGAFVEPLEPITDTRTFTDSQTRLPCKYKVSDGENVVQVAWYKVLKNGTQDPIIITHFNEGNREFGPYSGRVKFESFTPIAESSALLIPITRESDEGTYKCHVSTFPFGNFERVIKLEVWMLPISSLDAAPLVEGRSYDVVASCRAVGQPVPRLSWDTELDGRSQSRANEGGAVSILYSLFPLRSMNGKKLDCLVSHPGLEKPRRISNRLVVHYPPDPKISSPVPEWYVGLENAELLCEGGGNPKPEKVTWTRRGGALPDGASAVGEKLLFRLPVQLNDSGTYECAVRNSVGSQRTEYPLTILEKPPVSGKLEAAEGNLLIIIGVTAGALVLVLVVVVLVFRRHHQRKTKKLKKELQDTRDELETVSFNRKGSSRSLVSRTQQQDHAMQRLDSHTKYSLDHHHYKSSESFMSDRWGPQEAVQRDEFGRPVLWDDDDDGDNLKASQSRIEKEQHRKWVETYVKNSTMSLDSGLPSSLVPPKTQQDDGNGPKEPDLGHLPENDSIGESPTREGHQEDDGRSPQHLSEALSKMFYARNGVLRPIENPNAILLHGETFNKPQII